MKNILILLLTTVALCLGCSTEPENSTELFKVKVDSISSPTFGALSDTLVLRLYGTIGNDGCYSFSHIEDTRQPLKLDLTVWGEHSSAGACPAVMVYLDGKEYKWVATHTGWFVINIHQPDNSILSDSMIIK